MKKLTLGLCLLSAFAFAQSNNSGPFILGGMSLPASSTDILDYSGKLPCAGTYTVTCTLTVDKYDPSNPIVMKFDGHASKYSLNGKVNAYNQFSLLATNQYVAFGVINDGISADGLSFRNFDIVNNATLSNCIAVYDVS